MVPWITIRRRIDFYPNLQEPFKLLEVEIYKHVMNFFIIITSSEGNVIIFNPRGVKQDVNIHFVKEASFMMKLLVCVIDIKLELWIVFIMSTQHQTRRWWTLNDPKPFMT